MGHVSEQRSISILESALYTWLLQGKIPTPGELEQALKAEEERFGELTRSELRLVSPIERFSESSASGFTSAVNAIDSDRHVLMRALADINELSLSKLAEWNARAKALKVRVDKLISRVESLVLLESDSAGYAGFVEDGFRSLEKVSSATTASIDTSTGEVTLNLNRLRADPASGGTQLDVRDSSVDVGLIESSNTKNLLKIAGTSTSNMLWDSLNRWGCEVVARNPAEFRTLSQNNKPVILEVKIKLSRKLSVSRIVLDMADATAGTESVVSVQYSADGYTWNLVPSESPVQSGTGDFVFRFPATEMIAAKIIISKSSPDEHRDVGPIYDFGIQQIKFYSEEFEIDDAGVDLVTEVMTPRMAAQDVSFGRASLEVCEEIPSETSIRYFLRAYDGVLYTDWIQVVPISRAEEGSIAVVDFAAPTIISSEDITSVFDSSIDNEALNLMRVDGGSSLSYRFDGPNDTVANFYLPYTDNLLTNLVLLRNIGYSEGKYPNVSTDLKVGDIECGWGLDGESIYYCEFEVKNPSGMFVNFGSTQANLDGRTVSGAVNISSGWHKFRTSRVNWAPLQSSLFSSAPTTETELSAGDPLYPYNHKYLIEGYAYPDSFIGAKVYLGADIYAQLKATRIGINTLLESEFDNSIYAVDVISGPKTIILLKFDSRKSTSQNERVRFFFERRFESFVGIQLKANLTSLNSSKTPSLSYYRIRVQ